MKDPSYPIDTDFLDHLPPSADADLMKLAMLGGDPAFSRRIFVNRMLRMESIQIVGFDLDWTLADYDREAMTRLAFELTIERLIESHGYPEVIRRAEFRTEFPRRGLLVDREAGTVIKMNRHRYVGRAYFGRRRLNQSQRSELYRRKPVNPASDRFYHVDSLFELAEVVAFSEVVHLLHDLPECRPYASHRELFAHVRDSIDSIHADGTLKSRILGDLATYLPRDPDLPLALHRLGMNGRRRLLITNSEWYYTDAITSWLLDDSLPGYRSWRDYFDLVIVRSAKPGFFRNGGPFLRLDEGGEIVGEEQVPEWGGVYSGGGRKGLMSLLGCPGEAVLYVGDHIYGDVVSSKLRSTWRTALVVRELEDELDERLRVGAWIRRLRALKGELSVLGMHMDDMRDLCALYDRLGTDGVKLPRHAPRKVRALLKDLETEHRLMRRRAAGLNECISQAYNTTWGSLFKQGRNKSLFGSQVDDFACIYTSRVSNFARYGSQHYFRVLQDPMMHELPEV